MTIGGRHGSKLWLALAVTFQIMIAMPAFAWTEAPARPDPNRTPGAVNPRVTQTNIEETICVRGWTRTVRPPEDYTYHLKVRQLWRWGYPDRRTRDYEEDHLIPLELGGSPISPRNLWPEPWAGRWGAHTKDRLENRLHWLVCRGYLSLDAARDAIATNWIAAYREYVGDR